MPGPTATAPTTPGHRRGRGGIIDNGATAREMGRRIVAPPPRHARGERIESEVSGMGTPECVLKCVPWQIGVPA